MRRGRGDGPDRAFGNVGQLLQLRVVLFTFGTQIALCWSFFSYQWRVRGLFICRLAQSNSAVFALFLAIR
jgi:hypothetical protein